MSEPGSAEVGIGYTLGTGRLYCDFSAFQAFAEGLLERPVYTHEFASGPLWAELRDAYEAKVVEVWRSPVPEEQQP